MYKIKLIRQINSHIPLSTAQPIEFFITNICDLKICWTIIFFRHMKDKQVNICFVLLFMSQYLLI